MAVRSRKNWNPAIAAGILDELRRSGLSLAAFARARGISPVRLRAWRQRLNPAEAIAPRLVELIPVRRQVSAPSALRILLVTGTVIEVGVSDLHAELVAVLRAWADASC